MIADLERCVGLRRELDRVGELALQLADPIERRHPALGVGRLDDDALDVCGAVEHPVQGGRAHRGGGVEHQLRVFFRFDHHAIAELPIQYNDAITNPTNNITRTKHPRQKVTKADGRFNRELKNGLTINLL